jgi:hypothetical protein
MPAWPVNAPIPVPIAAPAPVPTAAPFCVVVKQPVARIEIATIHITVTITLPRIYFPPKKIYIIKYNIKLGHKDLNILFIIYII